MSTTSPLLIDLAGIARLADVQRPVVSMWRTRLMATAAPFPDAVETRGGRLWFDAHQVANWLIQTEHGNNPEAREDVAAAAAPSGFSFADESAVAELEALITLSIEVDDLLGDSSSIESIAARLDPLDDMLRSEIANHLARGLPWLEYAEQLTDSAYSPEGALALVSRRFVAQSGSIGSAGALAAEAVALVLEATRALAADATTTVILDPSDAELSLAIAAQISDQATLALPTEGEGRRLRRRLRVAGHLVEADQGSWERSIKVLRVPCLPGQRVSEMLLAVNEVSLGLGDCDAALVIGPARALVDAVGDDETQTRASTLRSGFVRGIVRLPAGLVPSATREPLGLWVLGTPTVDVPIKDRLIAVMDLTDATLTPATLADVVSDIVASTGSPRDVSAHSFRFARRIKTSTLQAIQNGSLIPPPDGGPAAPTSSAELAERIDAAGLAAGADITPIHFELSAGHAPPPKLVPELIRLGHLEMLCGTRLDPDSIGSAGLTVVTAAELGDPTTIGERRIDPFTLAELHPTAQLTHPGDVVFRTGPTAAAWVDFYGSKVVAYPARVLRIATGNPDGLAPEVIAADIQGATGGPGAWRRWWLRRVADHNVEPLRRALAAIEIARSDLQSRVARLDDYANLIVTGTTTGAVDLTKRTSTDNLTADQ